MNSWAATPDHMHPGVCSDRVWLPPVCPRNDQQLEVQDTHDARHHHDAKSPHKNHTRTKFQDRHYTQKPHTHPYRGWISRKLTSWVRGINLMHVPVAMSCIPDSMVILSMSSIVKKKKEEKNLSQTERLELPMPLQHVFKPVDSYHTLERSCRVYRRIHRLISATGRHFQGSLWRSVCTTWRCLPLWMTVPGGRATLMRKYTEMSPGCSEKLKSVQFDIIYSLLTAIDCQDLIHCIHFVKVWNFIWRQKRKQL